MIEIIIVAGIFSVGFLLGALWAGRPDDNLGP